MTSFCTSCGAPITGRFCSRCGAAVQETAAPSTTAQAETAAPSAPPIPQGVPAAAPAQAAPKGSGVKILLIVLGVFLFLGVLGVCSIGYVGYRAKQRIAELKREYAVDNEGTSSTASGATGSMAPSPRVFPASQGTGCKMLEGQEAAQILGVAVERVESDSGSPDGSLSCRYWVSAAGRQRLIKEQFASSLAEMSKADSKTGQADAQKLVENLIGGAAGAMNEANDGNKNGDYAFSLQVWQKNGKEHWANVETARQHTQDATGSDFAMQSVEGIGDRAVELPAGHSIMVLKGDTFFLLGFQQFVPGREKTAALARIVVGRI